MAQTYELVASPRDRVGKGSARALRREGKTPAVVYGDKQPPLSIAVDTKETFLKLQTLEIIVLGVVAFGFGTAGGVLLGKLMNKLSGGKINPLIGSAGVSAVPMAARVSQVEGQKANPGNFLLMHAMGPNVAGVIGSAIAAGILLSMFGA